MNNHKCENCSKETKPEKKFCNWQCYSQYKKDNKISEVRNCLNCQSEFSVNQKEIFANKKYCSPKCHYQHKTTKLIKNCLICKAAFKGEVESKYCSQKCNGISRIKNHPSHTCLYCKKSFPYNGKTLIATYCSKSCFYEDRREVKTKLVCFKCGSDFEVHKSQKNRKYCSAECYGNLWTGLDSRICLSCKVRKPVAEFAKSNKFKSGIKSTCKVCIRAVINQWRNKQRKTTANSESRVCIGCKKHLPSFHFRKDLLDLTGLKSRCKVCEKEFLKRYTNQRKAAVSRRRAREINAIGFFTAEQFQLKLIYWDFKCYLCGTKLNDNNVHAEHRIPLFRGGTNWIANIAPACANCNLRKGIKTEQEFKQFLQL